MRPMGLGGGGEDDPWQRSSTKDKDKAEAAPSRQPPKPRASPEGFSALSPDMAEALYQVRQRVLEIIATAPDPANPDRWMTLPWDAEAPGADAHTLEAAYQALHPTALRGFLNANAHHLTPACFDKIMGVGRGGDVEHNGLYWKSGPTLVATDTVNELPDGAVGVWLGACNGHWAVFNTSFTVRMLDLFPRHKKVKMHACDGTPYAAPGSQDFIMYACSLPAPSFLPPALRLALLALRSNGTFVATDIAGRDSPVMSALEALLRAYASLGLGRFERRQMHVPNQREVDQITFVRTAGEDGALDMDVPLLPLPERNRVPVLKAVPRLTRCRP